MESFKLVRLWVGRAWRAILAIGVLLGILYMPADILGIVETYPWLARFMPSREILLVGFAIICATYIAWIDARPYFSRYRTTSLKPFLAEGIDGKVVDWVDAAWAVIRAARKGAVSEFAIGHDKKKRDQLNWCLVILKHLSNEGLLPIFVRDKGEREWEPLSSHDYYNYHVHDHQRTLYRYHQEPWANDGDREIFDFDSVVVRLDDLKRVLKLYRTGQIKDHTAFTAPEDDLRRLPPDIAEEPR